MLRSVLLFLSNRQQLYRYVRRNRLATRVARRFVAGETLDEAVEAVRAVNAKGASASLDLLGESVTSEREARDTGDEYLRVLDRIRRDRLDCNVSLKLTAVGLDISEGLCEEIVREVLERACVYDNFVRLDMEGSAYTERTLNFFKKRLYPDFPKNVGIVLQSYLHRTGGDVKHAIELHARVRLCKGAYKEPAALAFQKREQVNENYIECMKLLMLLGKYPAFATHDENMIAAARSFAREAGVPNDRFEFQMLYGIRRDLQDELLADGCRLRVYIPYGTQWYPYLMRRLAERPANIAFVLGSVWKEGRRADARQVHRT
jgi:proline dehydrogenase